MNQEINILKVIVIFKLLLKTFKTSYTFKASITFQALINFVTKLDKSKNLFFSNQSREFSQ
jgi:hypothetical protein